jgi:hypothetical protein
LNKSSFFVLRRAENNHKINNQWSGKESSGSKCGFYAFYFLNIKFARFQKAFSAAAVLTQHSLLRTFHNEKWLNITASRVSSTPNMQHKFLVNFSRVLDEFKWKRQKELAVDVANICSGKIE